LTRRCGIAAREEQDPSLRRTALVLILSDSPDPQLAITSIVTALSDPVARNRNLALWGAKACRYELAGERDRIIPALQALSGDTDRDISRDLPFALEAFKSPHERPLATRAKFGEPTTITPDEVVRRLGGANSDALVRLYRELGIWPRLLLWPYNLEAGPYTVARFDLELDGAPGV